ncbi:hypothetical protein V8B97DRAFT_974025 [Scleroderma yunnanense]
MNLTGPFQPCLRRLATDGRVLDTSEYEDNLFYILGELGPPGVERLQQYYENRFCAGEGLTGHSLAMSLFLQDAADMVTVEEDRELARLLAEDLDLEEDNIAMSHQLSDIFRDVL